MIEKLFSSSLVMLVSISCTAVSLNIQVPPMFY
jgi:hypothetical protein